MCMCVYTYDKCVQLFAGRYLAELTKQVFLDIENSKYQVNIYNFFSIKFFY